VNLTERMERAWIIDCSRCSQEGIAYGKKAEAEAWFREQGWAEFGVEAWGTVRLFCPECAAYASGAKP
jgi:hypothetical protein